MQQEYVTRQEFAEVLQRIDERLARMEANQARMETNQARMEANQARLEKNQETMIGTLNELSDAYREQQVQLRDHENRIDRLERGSVK
ncbi:MAG: hypothetical protein OXI34_16285 [Chloroflexota bacterium]|nr:hypothetical protein [Chloroflexota bacterium]MDE2855920.1 hypothetical protein [Chloroflexota bacterium]MDE2945559.1 hypothetical protein [Chloroflexota bacterium]